jgi:hypothetical protein
MKPRSAAIMACGFLLGVAGPARADTQLKLEAGEAVVHSEDPSVANELTIEVRGTDVRFYEPKDPVGFGYPFADCRAGETRGSQVVEVFCPRTSVRSIVVEIGPAEDQVAYKVPDIPLSATGGTGVDALAGSDGADALYGEQGNDALSGGGGDDDLRGDDGNDSLDAGAGNDALNGGPGMDRMAAGAGDDTIDSADGLEETVDCGDGNDKAVADTLDDLVGCEEMVRREVAPPTDEPQLDDATKPILAVGGLSTQRVSRRRRSITLIATSNERGLIQAGAFLDAAGINTALRSTSAKVELAGGAVKLRIRFGPRAWRLIEQSLRKRQRARVRVTISAADATGNTSRARKVWVKLRR